MAARIVTQEQLKSQLKYNPDTGEFTRLIPSRRVKVGDVAGGTCKDCGYIFIQVCGVQCRAHRLAYVYMMGDVLASDQEIDHINGVRNDNRWGNLRTATRTQNGINTKTRTDNKSGQKGVSFRKDTGKWNARIYVGGKAVLLGDFANLDCAIAARKAAEPEFHGNFTRIEP